jgi:hypothetical protein
LAVRLRLPMACLIPSTVVVVVATGMMRCRVCYRLKC